MFLLYYSPNKNPGMLGVFCWLQKRVTAISVYLNKTLFHIDIPTNHFTAYLSDVKEYFRLPGKEKNIAEKYSKPADERISKEKVYIEVELWTCWQCEHGSFVGGRNQ